jgi:uncharacterized protein YggE
MARGRNNGMERGRSTGSNNGPAWPIVTLIAVLLLGAVAIIAIYHGSQAAYNPGPSSANHTITVTATGFATAQPSQVMFYIMANGTGSTTTGAVANLSATVATLNSTLYTLLGGNLSSVQTTLYDVQEECNGTYFPTAPLNGGGYPAVYPYHEVCNSTAIYNAEEDLQVTMNASIAGAAVGEISNITNVYINYLQPQFSNAQLTALKPAALSSAMSNATSQAMATLGSGYNLSIVNITVDSYSPILPFASAGSSAQAIIYPGTSSVSGTVTVVFAYQKT